MFFGEGVISSWFLVLIFIGELVLVFIIGRMF